MLPIADHFHHVRDFAYFEGPLGMKLELPSIGGFKDKEKSKKAKSKKHASLCT